MKMTIALSLLLFSAVVCAQQNAVPPNPQTAKPSTPNSEAKIDPVKEADIRKLLEIGGSRAAMVNIMGLLEKDIRPLLKTSLPPGEYRNRLVDLFFEKFHSKLDLQQMLDLAVPVYDKYFSDEDLKGMIAFYSTPLGEKMVKNLPEVTSELGENGRKFGEQVGRDSMAEVLSEHPDLKKALEEAARPPLPK